MNRLVTHEENYPIQPQDINTSRHFFDAFDNSETEVSANWIIRFLQQRGEGWKPFTIQELQAFYNQKFQGRFHFNRLIEPETVPVSLAHEFGRMAQHASMTRGMHPVEAAISYAMETSARPSETKQVGGGWIVAGANDTYFVTEDFIQRCHKSSPARKN